VGGVGEEAALSLVVSLDPGLRHLGLSVFIDGVLRHAILVRNPEKKARDGKAWSAMGQATIDALFAIDAELVFPDVLVSEIPQVYWGRSGGGNADDLIQLAGVVGAVAHAIDAKDFVAYRPRQWKGNVPKEAMCKRIESRLSAEELAAIAPCPASLRHNVVDSIGVGLKYLGRL
jgi:hypothetical protein